MTVVEYIRESRGMRTRGLKEWGQAEIRAEVWREDLVPECEAFLRMLVKYTRESGRVIKPNETIEYGYWLTRVAPVDEGLLEVWEKTADGESFVRGATLTLTYWKDQQETCNRVGSKFMPPRPDKMAAVSAGVYEGDVVDGVRYSPGENMSGWCLFTDRYNGDIRSLKYEHLYHVTFKRPDLARYVALEPGFCIDLHAPEHVWFDAKAAVPQQ